MRLYSIFVDVKEIIPVLEIWLKKNNNKRLVSIWIVNIVIDMMGSDFVTRTSAQSYFNHIVVSRMSLKREGIISFIESLKNDDVG